MELHEIKEKLKESLSKSRYEHTLGVANTATCLAMRYEYDLEKAYLAGLLHDCAKATPDKDKLRECRENNIPITRQEELLPHLLHAKLGEFKAKNEYGIDDPEILNAIKFHTTGRVNMSLLEKIIFVADYIEPGRDKAVRFLLDPVIADQPDPHHRDDQDDQEGKDSAEHDPAPVISFHSVSSRA